jgi:hypothetical protein
MSDSDDNVIEQLQAKRSRPRREPPARRIPRAAPAPPAVAINARKPDQRSPELEATDTPTQARTKQGARAAAAHSAPTPVLPALSEKAEGRLGTASADGDLSAPPDPPATGSLRLEADEPTANYAVRVRRSLDDLVAWRLAELRRHRVRASKVELTEMLLWELADADVHDIVARLERFRDSAPRQ